MKKKITIFLMFISMSLLVTGCRKEIETKCEQVTATIIGVESAQKYRGRIYAEYNGHMYDLCGYGYYERYKEHKGEQITVTLVTHIYEDGTGKQELLFPD